MKGLTAKTTLLAVVLAVGLFLVANYLVADFASITTALQTEPNASPSAETTAASSSLRRWIR